MRAPLVVLACVGLSGCRCEPNTQEVYGDGRFLAAEKVVVTEGVATIDFGEVAFGETGVVRVAVENRGLGVLGLQASATKVPFSVEPARADMAPSSSLNMVVTFSPPLSDEERLQVDYFETVSLDLAGAKEGQGQLRLVLRGRGVIPNDCLSLTPDVLDFGPVPLGCAASKAAIFRNGCAQPVQLLGLKAGDAGFAVDASPRGRWLAPAESIVLSTRYETQGRDASYALLRATSAPDGGRPATRQVKLSAREVERSDAVEQFPVRHAVDILMAASDSNTDAVTDFIEGSAFLQEALVDAGVDYHLGFIVLTWDWDNHCTIGELIGGQCIKPENKIGELVLPPDAGSPRYYTSSTPGRAALSASALLKSTAQRIPLENSNPVCLEGMRRAVTAPASMGANAGFLRDGVHLAIICRTVNFSDLSTTARSDEPGWFQPLPIQFYADALASARGGRHLVSVNALSSTAVTADVPRLLEAAQLTGGVSFGYPGNAWPTIYAALQERWTNFSKQFGLKGRVDQSFPLEVSLDGARLPTAAWFFEPDGGVLTLRELPKAGAQLEVSYTPQCE